MNQKYEISEIAHPQYPWLHRIRALSDVRPDVPKGHLGGYVQCEENLSQKGACWIADDAVVEQAVIRGDAEIKKDQRTRKSPRISGSALIYGTVVGNVSVSGASVVGKGEKIEGGRNSAFLVFFDGDMPTSGVNQRKGISQDSHKKQKRKTAHRGGER